MSVRDITVPSVADAMDNAVLHTSCSEACHLNVVSGAKTPKD